MSSEKEYYTQVFGRSLQELGVQKNDLGLYSHPKSKISTMMDKAKFRSFIRKSRTRAKLRWPKNMFTVENWLDYIIAKIERTQNIKIDMTPTEKKYWYIFGWKYFFRLSRKKLIK